MQRQRRVGKNFTKIDRRRLLRVVGRERINVLMNANARHKIKRVSSPHVSKGSRRAMLSPYSRAGYRHDLQFQQNAKGACREINAHRSEARETRERAGSSWIDKLVGRNLDQAV